MRTLRCKTPLVLAFRANERNTSYPLKSPFSPVTSSWWRETGTGVRRRSRIWRRTRNGSHRLCKTLEQDMQSGGKTTGKCWPSKALKKAVLPSCSKPGCYFSHRGSGTEEAYRPSARRQQPQKPCLPPSTAVATHMISKHSGSTKR